MPIENYQCSFCTKEALYSAIGENKITGETSVVLLCIEHKDMMLDENPGVEPI